eukprot:1579675-Pleurochrysis_carterae.AAC.1
MHCHLELARVLHLWLLGRAARQGRGRLRAEASRRTLAIEQARKASLRLLLRLVGLGTWATTVAVHYSGQSVRQGLGIVRFQHCE